MPYCIHCGAQNREGARFCEACGKLIGQADTPAPPQQQASRPVATPAESTATAKTLALVGVGIYAVGLVLSVMAGDMLNLVLCAGLAAGIYLAVYAPLQKGDVAAAKKGALAAGVACLIFMFLGLAQGALVGILFNGGAAACMGLAWNAIKT